MRILHVLDHSPPHASAYSRRVMAVLRQQRALGWQTCHLTGPHHRPPAPRAHTADGRAAPSRWHFYRTAAAAPGIERLHLIGAVHCLAHRLQQVVRLTRPDLLHAHSPLENALAALRVGRRAGLPVLFEAHAPGPMSPPGSIWARQAPALHGDARGPFDGACRAFAMRALEAWTAARAGAVVTNSEGMRRRLQAGGVAAGRITVVPDGLVLARYAVRGAISDGHCGAHCGAHASETTTVAGHILIGASANSEQGFNQLLAALAMVRQRHDARLLVACDGGRIGALRQLAERRGLAAQVTAVLRAGDGARGALAASAGWPPPLVSAAPTAQLHRLADIVVFCEAGMQPAAAPRKLLEAMARACVIAATDTPAHRGVIEHGRSGLLFATASPTALADALEVLLATRSRWPAMAHSARWFIEYQRSWELCVARYGPVYERLLAARRRSR